mgnify:CR=1 FL=1
MGYRSEVAYVIGFENAEAMSGFIATVMAVGSDEQRKALKECCLDWKNRTINYSAEDVKWYDSYPEVMAFAKFVDAYTTLADSEGGPSWAYDFIRVGEDYTDIETYESDKALGYLSVHRTIVSDV